MRDLSRREHGHPKSVLLDRGLSLDLSRPNLSTYQYQAIRAVASSAVFALFDKFVEVAQTWIVWELR